jgi:PAS domain S-box-containing protein
MQASIDKKRFGPVPFVAMRYGLAVVSVAMALGLTQTFLHFHLPQPFSALAFSAIAITFWYGGTKPGILATVLSMLLRDYLFDPGTNTVSRVLYDIVFLIFALLMTQAARARNELEVRVAERTADLTVANRELTLEIAERKQAEYLIGQVFECSPDGIVIIGRDYRYQRVNPMYERYWETAAEKIVGMHVGELLGMEVFEHKLKDKYDRCFAGEDVSYEDWFFDSSGQRRYLAITYSPLRPDSEHVEAVLVISRDLTEHMLASETLRQARADLAHVNRVTTMGELTASVAHEVNQPITAAVTNAKTCLRWLTRDCPDIEEARAAAMRIVKDGTRAAEIINRIRLLFKKETPQRELLDVNEVIREMIVLLRTEANRYSISVRTELALNIAEITADRVQLQQVLLNLIMNSIDAMKDVDGTRDLVIKSQPAEHETVVISVSDTGVGLPPQEAEQIFNAFYTTKPQGTGMGLSISRSIIESHGGRLWASNNSPSGATFHISLPSDPDAHE